MERIKQLKGYYVNTGYLTNARSFCCNVHFLPSIMDVILCLCCLFLFVCIIWVVYETYFNNGKLVLPSAHLVTSGQNGCTNPE